MYLTSVRCVYVERDERRTEDNTLGLRVGSGDEFCPDRNTANGRGVKLVAWQKLIFSMSVQEDTAQSTGRTSKGPCGWGILSPIGS